MDWDDSNLTQVVLNMGPGTEGGGQRGQLFLHNFETEVGGAPSTLTGKCILKNIYKFYFSVGILTIKCPESEGKYEFRVR